MADNNPDANVDEPGPRSRKRALVPMHRPVGARLVVGEDRHGDLTSLFAPTGTSLSDTFEYDPFGVPTARTGSTVNHLGFQSDYTDPTTALVNMGARWYAPTSDSFMSRDSYSGVLRSPVSLNRYTYANNNPITYFDPDGHSPADACASGAKTTGCGPASGPPPGHDPAPVIATPTGPPRGHDPPPVIATPTGPAPILGPTAVSPPGSTIVTADAAEHRASGGPQGSCFVSGAHFSGMTVWPTMTCPNSLVPDPLGSLYGKDRVTAIEIISLAKDMVPTAGGYCSSIGIALFVVAVDFSGCIVQTETDAGVLVTASVGGGFLPPDAHIGAGSMLSNASNMDQFKGESACVGGSADFGFGANVAVCAGLRDNGGFSGIVSITGLVTASTTPIPSIGLFLAYSTTGEFFSTPPKNYRNPDGSCTSGNSTDRCGEGSMNNGLPGGFP